MNKIYILFLATTGQPYHQNHLTYNVPANNAGSVNLKPDTPAATEAEAASDAVVQNNELYRYNSLSTPGQLPPENYVDVVPKGSLESRNNTNTFRWNTNLTNAENTSFHITSEAGPRNMIEASNSSANSNNVKYNETASESDNHATVSSPNEIYYPRQITGPKKLWKIPRPLNSMYNKRRLPTNEIQNEPVDYSYPQPATPRSYPTSYYSYGRDTDLNAYPGPVPTRNIYPNAEIYYDNFQKRREQFLRKFKARQDYLNKRGIRPTHQSQRIDNPHPSPYASAQSVSDDFPSRSAFISRPVLKSPEAKAINIPRVRQFPGKIVRQKIPVNYEDYPINQFSFPANYDYEEYY